MTLGKIEADDGRVTRFEMRISKPPPGYQAGLALNGQHQSVFFGMDSAGKPVIVERKGDITRVLPLDGEGNESPP